MSDQTLLDSTEICAPIIGEHPTGSDIRQDKTPQSLYYQIRDARNRARSSERKMLAGEQVPDLINQWQDTLNLGRSILINQTKDMEILTWLIEALIRVEGIKGLTLGYQIAYRLIEQFWEGLFPLPEEGDYEYRLSAFTGLNGAEKEGTLIGPIRNLFLVEEGDKTGYTLWQYNLALEINRISDVDKRTQRIQAIGFSLEDIQKCVEKKPASYFKELTHDIANCIEVYNAVISQLDALGMNIPSSNIAKSLEEYRDSLYTLAASKINDIPNSLSLDTEGGPAESQNDQLQFNDREKAFNLIEQAAVYFRRHEPHSPVSYMLDRVSVWGRLSYPELMEKMVSDQNSLAQIYSLIGVNVEK